MRDLHLSLIAGCLTAGLCAAPMLAADAKTDLAPTGTLRAVFLGQNPVHGRPDPKTGEHVGPVPDLVKELARRLGVPYKLIPGANSQGVIDGVNQGTADIGFLAYDETRAREVDFSAPYLLMFNSFLVKKDGPIVKSADVDKPGVKIGAVQGQSQQHFLSETIKNATVKVMAQGPPDAEMERMILAGEIDAFGENRERAEATAANKPTLRALPDNFLSVGQALIVKKGDAQRLEHLNRFVQEVIASGFVQGTIDRSKLSGVGVAPLGKR